MDLSAVMDEIGLALATIHDLRVSDFSAQRVTPPAAIVAWPEDITFDATFQRGSDSLTIPVYILVGTVDARTSRDRLAKYLNGSGADSVKTAVDGFAYTACDSARVVSATIEVMTIAGVEYLAGVFQVEVFG